MGLDLRYSTREIRGVTKVKEDRSRSLRRHYPDQVRRVTAGVYPDRLSASCEAPLGTTKRIGVGGGEVKRSGFFLGAARQPPLPALRADLPLKGGRCKQR